jgi:cytochrome P450
VILNCSALHTLPSYWGADSLVWRPGRWLDGKEEIIQPPPGRSNPWTVGPRVCPGKKFSQVEFVAVIARLFQKERLPRSWKWARNKKTHSIGQRI